MTNEKFVYQTDTTGVVYSTPTTGINYGIPKPVITAPVINTKIELRTEARKHNHYFKDVSKLQTIDVYRVLSLFNVTDPCIQHAVKKLLVAGGRGAGKDIKRDIKEAIDTLSRWVEMQGENESRNG
jgi:hypothetical protein